MYSTGHLNHFAQVDEVMKYIGTNKNGGISFEEFYAWWNSAELVEKEHSERAKRLSVIKMKLRFLSFLTIMAFYSFLCILILYFPRSVTYMRMVSRLLERLNHNRRAAGIISGIPACCLLPLQ